MYLGSAAVLLAMRSGHHNGNAAGRQVLHGVGNAGFLKGAIPGEQTVAQTQIDGIGNALGSALPVASYEKTCAKTKLAPMATP